VTQHAPVRVDGVGGVPAALVAQHGHQPALARRSPVHGGVVDAQVGVAVEHEEALAQQRQGAAQRAGGAGQPGRVVGVADVEAERGADARLHLVALVADAHDHALRAVVAQQLELPERERAPGHGQERLGRAAAKRAQPRAQAAGQDRDRREAHWTRR